jgi:tape measure domain-containing protein
MTNNVDITLTFNTSGLDTGVRKVEKGMSQVQSSVQNVQKSVEDSRQKIITTFKGISTTTVGAAKSFSGLEKAVKSTTAVAAAAQPAMERVRKAVTAVGDSSRKTSKELSTFGTALKGVQRAATLVDGPLGKYGSRISQIQTISNESSVAVKRLAFGFAGLAAASGLFLTKANEFQNYTNKLRIVTNGQEELVALEKTLAATAIESRAGLDSTINLYSKLARTTAGATKTQEDLVKIVSSVNKAVALTGGTTQSTSAAIFQFTQGLQSGVLRGAELNSVLEQTPELAKLIADGLGVSLEEIRRLAEQGFFTTERVIQGIEQGAAKLDGTFSKTQITIDQATANFNTRFTLFVGVLDQTLEVSQSVAQGIQFLTNNLEGLTKVIASVAAGAAGTLLPSLITLGVKGFSGAATAALTFSKTLVTLRSAMVGAAIAGYAQAFVSLASQVGFAKVALMELQIVGSTLLRLINPWTAGILAAGAAYAYLASETEKVTEAERFRQTLLGDTSGLIQEARDRGKELAAASGKQAQELIKENEARKKRIQLQIVDTEAQIRLQRSLAVGATARAKQLRTENSAEGRFAPSSKTQANMFDATAKTAEKAIADLEQRRKKYQEELKAFNNAFSEGLGAAASTTAKSAETLAKRAGEALDDQVLTPTQKAIRDIKEAEKTLILQNKGKPLEGKALENFKEFERLTLAQAAAETKVAPKIRASAKATKDRATAVEQALQSLRDSVAQDIAEADSLGKSNYERLVAKNTLIAEKAAREDYNEGKRSSIKLTQEELDKVSKLTKAQAKAADEVTAAQKRERDAEEERRQNEQLEQERREALQRPFEQAANRIQETFSDTFAGIFDGSIDSAGDAAKAIKGVFVRMAAEIAALAIFRPDVFQGKAGGSLSSITDMIFPSLGKAGGKGGKETSLLEGLSGLANTPLFSKGSTLSTGINKAGSFLGLGKNVAGNFTAGTSLAGFTGNFGADLILGNRGVGASVGGTAGSIGGTIIGTALGGPLGGVIGSALGAFAGNAIGGLFGNNKPSDKTQSGVQSLATGNVLSRTGLGFNPFTGDKGKKFSQENADFRDAAFTYASGIAEIVTKETGEKLKQQLTLEIGNRDGFRFQIEGAAKKGFGTQGSAFFQTLTQDLIALGGAAVEGSQRLVDLRTAVTKIDFKDTQQALNDVAFALNFSDLGNTPEVITETRRAFDELNASFDEMAKTTERLGLSEERLEQARKKSVEQFRTDLLQGVLDDIAQTLNPLGFFTQQENKNLQQRLKDAQTVGITDTAPLLLQSQLNLLKIQQQYAAEAYGEQINVLNEQLSIMERVRDTWTDISKNLRDAVSNLRIGRSSILSPQQRLNEARSRFNETSLRARLGDETAARELVSLGNDLLELSREFNASTTGYANDFMLVESALKSVADVADRQVDIQTQQLTIAQRQLEELQKLTAQNIKNSPEKIQSLALQGLMVSANNANELYLRNAEGIRAAGLTSFVDSALAAATPNVQAGEGRRSLFFENNPIANEALIRTLRERGVPGFATGGLVGGQRPIIVGETGPEMFVPSSNGRVVPLNNITSPSDEAVRKEVHALRVEIAMLHETLKHSVNLQAEELRTSKDQALQLRRRAD